MTVIQKCICIPEEVAMHIAERSKHGFNFSEWIAEQYTNQFMSLDGINKRISQHKADIEALDHERAIVQDRINAIKTTLTKREQGLIKEARERLTKGFDLNANRNLFNNQSGREFSLAEFEQLIELYE